MKFRLLPLFITFFGAVYINTAEAQFIDHFDKQVIDPAWGTGTGDGNAHISLVQGKEHAKVLVDATDDKLNIWWAIIRCPVPGLDMEKLVKPGFELRVEARIKVSHAPRRVNLHFNHQRTTDFHSNLKEFYIDDTTQWHVISMTTEDFDVRMGDTINVQMALMDWGLQKYEIELDYIKVDVVDKDTVGPDLGSPLQYHPEIPKTENFIDHVGFSQDVTVDKNFPDMNFYNWGDSFNPQAGNLLAVGTGRYVILRTDFSEYADKKVNDMGLLEMHVYHLERSSDFKKDFGHVRLVEIIGGDTDWTRESVTFSSLLEGKAQDEVINGQMIIDVDLSQAESGTVYFAIPRQVIQRLLTNRTKGLAILPLGAISASFYGSEQEQDNLRPTLHFNVE